MSVKSARVQKIIKGDDVILTHQILQDIAYNAEQAKTPVTIEDDDVVKFFYEYQDADSSDLIGNLGVKQSGSIFTVEIPSSKTLLFKSGEGQTVRAEITKENGDRHSYYLYQEVDIYERGFPIQETELNLP